MEHGCGAEFCPRCQSTQATFEHAEDGHTVVRCQMCGFPVRSGLTLAEPLPGFPSPPEVTVLCVDDDLLFRQVLVDALRFKGYRVIAAADGPAALDVVATERPDLILLDVVMPGMDGFEVCRRVKGDPGSRHTPVILLTAMSDAALNRRAFEAGAELALRKPTETAVILRTVEAALSLVTLRAATDLHSGDEAAGGADLAVPTREAWLEFWMQDGAPFRARLRLHLHAESHGGPETVQDRLNGADLFLPLEVPGEGRLFLNKTQVVRVDVKEGEEAAGVSGDCEFEAVRVQLSSGEQLAGTLRIEGPAERRRLSDFLNTQAAFLPLLGADRLHLLQKRFIARVIPGNQAG